MTDAHAKAVEAAATKIYEVLEGPIADQDFRRQQRQAALVTRLSVAAITAYLAAMRAEGWVMVPSVATVEMVTAAMSRPDYGASTTLFYGEIYRAMTEAAMLKWVTDEQG